MNSISPIIRQVSTKLNETFTQVIVKGQATKQKIHTYWTAKSQDYQQSELWKQHGKPLYERNIQPLNQTDAWLLGGSVITAFFVYQLVLKIFTDSAFPFAFGLGGLVLLEAGFLCRSRIRRYFNEIAWEQLNHIKTCVQNHDMDPIDHHRNRLRAKEFDYLKDDIDKLDGKIRVFKTAYLSQSVINAMETVIKHLAYLKTLPQDDQDKAYLEALEQQLQEVEQNGQNLSNLEEPKQELDKIKAEQIHSQIENLQIEIDHYIEAKQNLINDQIALLEFINDLQRKLVPDKTP